MGRKAQETKRGKTLTPTKTDSKSHDHLLELEVRRQCGWLALKLCFNLPTSQVEED